MGSGQIQSDLWGARSRNWSELQEVGFRTLYAAVFEATKIGKDAAP